MSCLDRLWYNYFKLITIFMYECYLGFYYVCIMHISVEIIALKSCKVKNSNYIQKKNYL